MTEKAKVFTLQGIEFVLDVMTLRQDLELGRLLIKVTQTPGLDLKDLEKLLEVIIDQGLLRDFFLVILRPKDQGQDLSKFDEMELNNDELEEIMADFFGLNGGAIQRLRGSWDHMISLGNKIGPAQAMRETKTES